ncbi:hypothetical protein [Nitrosomonas sp.]|uniref:hypothetical protein n=1 Tax=Nitrosomonas sp. TaxID=42353 RepID=UPI00260F2285|nr:hypothetical protein [Nitrosomonas sp.]
MTNEALFLASEIKELEALLASVPADALIERMSLEARLLNAREVLAALPEQISQKAKLTFRGKPVLGSHGIAADFGAKAAGAFSDAFSAIAAALSSGLRDMGPIPDRDKNQLLITGTAIGSFGFEFELPAEEPSLFPETAKAQEAMKTIESLFRLAAEGSDDAVAEVIEEIHPRAVRKVHDFLELLVQQQAWCALEFDDRFFRFSDYEQIKLSSERLRDENIQEREESYQGEFQGVLPASRSFEFKLSSEDEIIKGKVDKTVADPDILNREWLHKPVTVVLHVMQVGQGRPRFTLMKLDDLEL